MHTQVGFGDFSPPSTSSRLITALYVTAIVAYVPAAVGEAVKMYGEKRHHCVGRAPSPWQHFVVLVGPVTPSQLSMFVHEFCSLRGTSESQTHFVLLSPLELTVRAPRSLDHAQCPQILPHPPQS